MSTHTIQELRQFQAMPLPVKIAMTQTRIRAWVDYYGKDGVYVSFSGGKDSTVLLHLVRELYPDVPAVFVDTGLEYPEIREFVKTFNNVTWLKPKMNFRQVIEKYGYPVISKDVAQAVYDVKGQAKKYNCSASDTKLFHRNFDSESEYCKKYPAYSKERYAFLIDAPFPISHKCCDVMKKTPAKEFEKLTGKHPIIGTMADESRTRRMQWLQKGCNAFDCDRPRSTPMAFWTEQDVLRYIKEKQIPICSVYGEIMPGSGEELEGQMDIADYGLAKDVRKLKLTQCNRTGCMFCMFGCTARDWDNPGGYLLAFGGSRTYHRIACAIEDAGFEIRDTIMWIYGSGFPKSMNLGKSIESKLVNGSANTQDWKNLKGTKVETGDWGVNANAYEYGARPSDYSEDGHLRVDKVDYQTKEGKQWDGWGTCLKPAYEPIILARKPCEGSTTDNVLKYGVGGINIGGCRIPLESNYVYKECNRHSRTNNVFTDDTSGFKSEDNHIAVADPNGRFPSNVILTYDDTDYDEVCGGMPDTKSNGGLMTMPDFKDAGQKNSQNKIGFNDGDTAGRKQSDYFAPIDSGSAARYFYCAKASNKDRDEGLEKFEVKQCTGGGGGIGDYLDDVNSCSGKFGSEKAPHGNIHPTVKPCELMQYLVRLVTPKGGIVLDPFNGSGSTGKACIYENKELEADYKYIGIELTEEYLPIANARIKYAEGKKIQGRLLL